MNPQQKTGSKGVTAPSRSCEDIPPRTLKRGGCQPRQTRHEWDQKRRQTLSQRGWANGGPGGGAPWRGVVGGVPLKKQKRERVAHISNPPRVGPKTLANPKLTRVGKGGGGGAAPSQGLWGMCPQNKKRGGELPALTTRPRVGPKTLANPQPTGVGKGGSRGRSPLAGGMGGVPPRNQNLGRATNPYKPTTSGAKTLAYPKLTGVGKTFHAH